MDDAREYTRQDFELHEDPSRAGNPLYPWYFTCEGQFVGIDRMSCLKLVDDPRNRVWLKSEREAEDKLGEAILQGNFLVGSSKASTHEDFRAHRRLALQRMSISELVPLYKTSQKIPQGDVIPQSGMLKSQMIEAIVFAEFPEPSLTN